MEFPRTRFYGGMTYTTTCCVNHPSYRPGVDVPCNAAGALAPHYAAVFFALVSLSAALLVR